MWFLYAAFKYKTPRKIQETEVGEGAEREVGSLDLLIALPWPSDLLQVTATLCPPVRAFVLSAALTAQKVTWEMSQAKGEPHLQAMGLSLLLLIYLSLSTIYSVLQLAVSKGDRRSLYSVCLPIYAARGAPNGSVMFSFHLIFGSLWNFFVLCANLCMELYCLVIFEPQGVGGQQVKKSISVWWVLSLVSAMNPQMWEIPTPFSLSLITKMRRALSYPSTCSVFWWLYLNSSIWKF